jgi:hypothetical protein
MVSPAALEAFAASDWAGNSRPRQPCAPQWEHVIPFFAYPPAVRKIIDTSNSIKTMHMLLCKVINSRPFPQRRSGQKTAVSVLAQHRKESEDSPITWKQAANHFAILFGERFTNALNRDLLPRPQLTRFLPPPKLFVYGGNVCLLSYASQLSRQLRALSVLS